MNASFLANQAPEYLRRYCAKIGIEVPKEFAETQAAIVAARARIDALATRSDIADAILAAVDAGQDPAATQAVRDAVISHQARMVAQDIVAETLRRREISAAIESFDALVEACRPKFEAAAGALTEAVAILGDVDLKNADAILRLGRNAGAAFSDLGEAGPVIEDIRFIWKWMAGARGAEKRGEAFACIVEHDLERWLAEPILTQKTPVEIVREGWKLELHTYSEVRAFLASAETETTKRRDAARAEVMKRGFNG